MYLAKLSAENFRVFGKGATKLDVELSAGLNVLVGENDAGKTAFIDALRLVLWTSSSEYYRLTEDDFHGEDSARSEELIITCRFTDLSVAEEARFLEWLTFEDGHNSLYVTLQATLVTPITVDSVRRRKIEVSRRAGRNGDGPEIASDIVDFLRCTYLKPLRDADAELSAGRGSRLAQILSSHPKLKEQKDSDFDPDHPEQPPQTLVGIMRQAEHRIKENVVVKDRSDDLNNEYLTNFAIGEDPVAADIGIAESAELRQILEKLELVFQPDRKAGMQCGRGLGYSNLLFMATELLLLNGKDSEANSLLLIEEPEAHLHPQLQVRLMSFLEEQAAVGNESRVQIIVTTHSPNLASKVPPENIILLKSSLAYSLSPAHTQLAAGDYRFLRRFLDVTKANLFFAKGVLIVEGDAENLLLPTLARKMGRSLEEHGVSIVNVGHTGLHRYSRILQRQSGPDLPIRVACVKDLDYVPVGVDYITEERRNRQSEAMKTAAIDRLHSDDGGFVKSFLTENWTFEYELAASAIARSVHAAITLATKSRDGVVSEANYKQVFKDAYRQYLEWRAIEDSPAMLAARIYQPLFEKKASKAIVAQFLAEILERDRRTVVWFRASLPAYIVAAIDWATSATPTVRASHA